MPPPPQETRCLLFRVLPSTTPRPTQLAELCGFHAASALEGALPTAAPYEGGKLSDSVVGVRTLTSPMAPNSPPPLFPGEEGTPKLRNHREHQQAR
jgi:hypothetical protein